MMAFNPTHSSLVSYSGHGVTAVLGPTNTGKTHLAIERMVAHSSGIIGLPLRLLAREVYQKLVDRTGEHRVALVTGEEKIIPDKPSYWVATVEAMPRDIDVAFVAIDEVQLAADLSRGHTFTDRILNLRGREETLLLGAMTVKGLLESLLPGLSVITRPRMSQLTYAGSKKLTRLPRRSAAIAFTAGEVYAIAELIRRQRGGAAVVLGALSPRTRNAQVEIYQSGDVDFIVATDAIGMGLNLDVDHVAFASNKKFDGFSFRDLTPGEMSQIAGRAGRHLRDGTFGVTAQVDPFDDALVRRLESHEFEPIRVIQWRNNNLDFDSLKALRQSLDTTPESRGLSRALPQDDLIVLEALMRDDGIANLVDSPEKVQLVWDGCQIPDYRKIAPAQHAEIVRSVCEHLLKDNTIPDEWFARHVRQTENTHGDIDTLAARIAHIRTWTFIANRADWLDDPAHWQERTRAIEDKLSDALHDKLTQRFIDRRTSVLMRRLRENTMLETEIKSDGDVQVEGQHVGWLYGLRFFPDHQAEDGLEAKAVRNAAAKALAGEITQRAGKLADSPNESFVLGSDASIRWQGNPVAKLLAGDSILKPRILLLADEQLTGEPRDKVDHRVNLWLDQHIKTLLKPLFDLEEASDLEAMARGFGYRLFEALGSLDRRFVHRDVKGLDQTARGSLRKYGVRFGAYTIFIPALLKPAPSTLLALLWAIQKGDVETPGVSELPALSATGRTSVPVEPDYPQELYAITGFKICGQRAVRFDILERLADLIRPLIAFEPRAAQEGVPVPEGAEEGNAFSVTLAMTSLLGSSGEDFNEVLQSVGYRVERRTIKRPVVKAEPAAQILSEAETPSTQQSADNQTQDASETDINATAPQPEETDAAQPEVITATAPENPTSDLNAPSLNEQVTEEEIVIELWRPSRSNHHARQQMSGEQSGKTAKQSEGRSKPEGKTNKPHKKKHKGSKGPNQGGQWQSKPSKKDKMIDPDNPFAALAGLKQDLKRKSG
jgi:ATP-dependent RNA helicase SUPV3L1/SUV3